MCKNNSWKIRTGTSGEGVSLEIRTRPGMGRGQFENLRFWWTFSVNGPLRTSQVLAHFIPPVSAPVIVFSILNFKKLELGNKLCFGV